MPNFEYEKLYHDRFQIIAGVDEVGRGSLAGPIVAAAVVFSDYENLAELEEIDDSKVLSKEKRLELDKLIKSKAHAHAIREVSVEEIEKYGIGAANIIAFDRALCQISGVEFALIDGRKFRGFPYPYQCLEKGESKSISIAAASIIAKVYRDDLMERLHDQFPAYDFAKNKGYGSQRHWQAIEKYGPTPDHRLSFLNINENLSLF